MNCDASCHDRDRMNPQELVPIWTDTLPLDQNIPQILFYRDSREFLEKIAELLVVIAVDGKPEFSCKSHVHAKFP